MARPGDIRVAIRPSHLQERSRAQQERLHAILIRSTKLRRKERRVAGDARSYVRRSAEIRDHEGSRLQSRRLGEERSGHLRHRFGSVDGQIYATILKSPTGFEAAAAALCPPVSGRHSVFLMIKFMTYPLVLILSWYLSH